MPAPDPWLFAAVGTLMAVSSAAMTHWAAARKDRERREIESRIIDIDRKISDAMQIANLRREIDTSAKVLEFLEQVIHFQFKLQPRSASPPPQVADALSNSIVRQFITKFAHIYTAVTEKECPDKKAQDWEDTIRKMKAGDKPAMVEYLRIDTDLADGLIDRVKSLKDQRDKLRIEKQDLDLIAERRRYLGLTCQIVGLLIVLLKDLPLQLWMS
jgi:hypothetical protein